MLFRSLFWLWCACFVVACAPPVQPPSPTLSPSTASISVGENVQLSLVTTVMPLPAVTWSSSNVMVATVNNTGLVTGVSPGMTTITASIPREGMIASTATAVITVLRSTVVQSVTVSGAASVAIGAQANFTARARYADGTDEDVTNMAQWSSSSPSVATINATNGIATGVGSGSTIISASFGGQQGVAGLQVIADEAVALSLDPPSGTLIAGSTQTLTVSARAMFPDGTTRDVNGDASLSWSSSDTRIATVMKTDRGGVVTAGSMRGPMLLTARFGRLSATASIMVVASDVPSGIELSPMGRMAIVGENVSFTATALFPGMPSRDVTAMTTFSSSNPMLVEVLPSPVGTVRCRSFGTVTIRAEYQGLSAETRFTCQTSEPHFLALEAPQDWLFVGTTLPLRARMYYTDGTNADVTPVVRWQSSSPGVTVTAAGIARGEAEGTAELRANLFSITSRPLVLRVLLAAPRSLTIEAPTRELPSGMSVPLRAMAAYPNGAVFDVTAQTVWMSDANDLLSVSTAGVARVGGRGSPTITASFRGISAATTFQTSDLSRLSAVEVSPSIVPSFPVASSTSFRAGAIFGNGFVFDVTRDPALTWASSVPSVLAVDSSATLSKGRATATRVGDAEITARFALGSSAPMSSLPVAVSVTNATVRSLTASLEHRALPVGFATRISVFATLSDGTLRDVSRDPLLTIQSMNLSVASFFQSASEDPWVRARSVGRADLLLFYGRGMTAPTTTLTLDVTAATLSRFEVAPSYSMVPMNGNASFRAQGYFSDGTVLDLTHEAHWTMASGWDVSNGFVSNLPERRGRFFSGSNPVSAAQGANQLVATIFRPDGMVLSSATASMRVSNRVEVGFQLFGGNAQTPFLVPERTTVPLRVLVTLREGAEIETRDWTDDADVIWRSFSPSVGRVSLLPESRGRLSIFSGAGMNVSTVVGSMGFASSELVATVAPAGCTIGGIELSTSPQRASPNVAQPSMNLPVNSLGRGATRSLYAWGRWMGSSCPAGVAPFPLTDDSRLVWSSSAPNVASVSNELGQRGVVTAANDAPVTPVGMTSAEISARWGTLEARFQVRTTDVCVRSLQLRAEAGDGALPVGIAHRWIAEATMSDGSVLRTSDGSLASNALLFTVSDGSVLRRLDRPLRNDPVEFFPTGTFETLRVGTATVTARVVRNLCRDSMGSLLPVSANATATVGTATITALLLSFEQITLSLGSSVPVSLFAVYSDGRFFDVTALAAWPTISSFLQFSSPQWGVSEQQMFVRSTATVGRSEVLTARFRGQSATANVFIGAATTVFLESIVTSASACRAGAESEQLGGAAWPVGADVPLVFRGRTSVGAVIEIPSSSLTITVSNPSVASVRGGVLSFLAPGTTTIIATHTANPMLTVTSPTVTVVSAALRAMQVRPRATSGTPPMFAMARRTTMAFGIAGSFDGFTAVRSDGTGGCPIASSRGVQWSVSPTQPGWTIDATGLATASATTTVGPVRVNAQYTPTGAMLALQDSLDGVLVGGCVQSIEVNAMPSSVMVGGTALLTATEVYSDGSRYPLFGGRWQSSRPSVASVLSNGNGAATARALTAGASLLTFSASPSLPCVSSGPLRLVVPITVRP